MAEKTPDYTWQIATGIVVGLLIWGAIERRQVRSAEAAAFAEFNRQTSEIMKPGADPLGWRSSAAAARRREAGQRADAAHKNAPTPGERCIGGLPFRRIENGWEQIAGEC